jgi:DNA mismatch repair protein MutS2
VLSVSEETQEVEVQAGQSRLSLGLDRVVKVPGGSVTKVKEAVSIIREPEARIVSWELDLRGRRADEVEWALDSYLNDASLAGLSEVRIIHGVGTGTVRSIVRDFLASHPLVNSFRPGRSDEGGDGVTMARL